jgi:LAO/AO transport system kinase
LCAGPDYSKAFLMRTEDSALEQSDKKSIEALAANVRAGDRVQLARAITLVESRKLDHRPQARFLLMLLNEAGGHSHRVGITGVPGVGKSTLIDRLGSMLTERGHRVAVLAVDPSSRRSGGAILGDKTRMPNLATDPNAFIRPSPTSGTLGGVARTTRESILLCEAAGFDIVLVETVGVGQSETTVAGMVDFFLLLMLAGGGDELQGIKKGVMELADMIAITKADGPNEGPARVAAANYTAALHILTPQSAIWKPPVVTVSASEGQGLDELWAEIIRHRGAFEAAGEFNAKRSDQDVYWMHAMIEDQIRETLLANPSAAARIAELERQVRTGATPPSVAADEATALILGPRQ